VSGVQSREADRLLSDLLSLPPEERRPWYRRLSPPGMAALMARSRHELGSRYGLWQDDPVGFVQDVLRVATWSGQERVMESVRDHVRTGVPATHAPGKTFTGGSLALWFGAVWPIGTAQVITTAPKLRQVKNIMWPGIRRLHSKAKLPGVVTATQWKVGEELIGYGFSAADYDEDAVQGIHAPHVLFIVDEAGGIGHTLGRAYTAVLSQPHARQLMIGNPPTDEEGTWFEEQCEKAGELVNTIRLSAYDTPNFTGERTGRCTTCPAGAPAHRIAAHLTPVEWVTEAIEEFGEESAFVEARVHARFPSALGQKVIPFAWVEAAAEDDHEPAAGQWVRLGADIAAEGGDEFVIARTVGYAASVVYRSSGAANADPVNLAGKITEHTREACELRDRLGDDRPVHVKIDASGMGWGVAGLVRRQVEEMGLAAVVLGVRGEDPPNDETQFKNARSELWWNTRRLIKPTTDPLTGAVIAPGKVKLVDAPTRLLAQLSAPKYATDSAGRIIVEKKKDTKKRIGGSPDLADAVNLALYEPRQGGPAGIERAATSIPTGTRAGGLRPPPAGGGSVIPLGPPRR
jgi:hypothetical protein